MSQRQVLIRGRLSRRLGVQIVRRWVTTRGRRQRQTYLKHYRE